MHKFDDAQVLVIWYSMQEVPSGMEHLGRINVWQIAESKVVTEINITII